MIEGRADETSAEFVARLTAKARRLAESRLVEPHGAPQRWRRAGLLWPLFAKD